MGGGRGRKLLTLCGRFLRLHLSVEKEGNEDLPESEWVSKEAGYKHAGGGGDGRGSQQKLMVIQMTSLTKVAGNQRLLPPNPQKQKKMGGQCCFPVEGPEGGMDQSGIHMTKPWTFYCWTPCISYHSTAQTPNKDMSCFLTLLV